VTLLESLDRTEDVKDRYPFHRILVLVGGGARAETDELIRVMGLMGIGSVLRDEGFGQTAADPGHFGDALLAVATRMLSAREIDRTSLCAAGGGITGIFFELGALKCLDDCLRPSSGDDGEVGGANAFDMYFGISAGAVVTAPLVVGYSVGEFMAAVAGEPAGRLPRLDLRLFELGPVDLPGHAFSLERASAVADRLRTSAHPKFSDFFPDGRVALRRSPLAGLVGGLA